MSALRLRWLILCDFARRKAMDWLHRRGLPGAILPLDHYDELTGQRLQIRVSPYGTRICINGRDYHFRLSGRLDGTGMGVCDAPGLRVVSPPEDAA